MKWQVGARLLVAKCDPALHYHAESVLRLLDELDAAGCRLDDGTHITLGWSRLSLRAEAGQLVVCEPRFDGNALVETRDDITRSLAILVEQSSLVSHLGVASQPTAYDQWITVAVGALDQPRCYAERQHTDDPDDSGWYIGPSDPSKLEVECERIRAYELLHRRPALLPALALPTGYLIAFDGASIEAVLDDADCDLWHPS
ncbi:MAG TPA: hypothetical protein VFQ53_23035 [Kofleriaceae bacterium]|nr:hypothetical protein [Kofleriaceae bacterium]